VATDQISAAIESGIRAIALEIPRCDAERHGAELYGAPRFSVFSLFGDRETTLSRVLADLLDPSGSHGQGLVFVNALLEMLELDRLSRLDRSVSVRTEAPVSVEGRDTSRRIDILIETADFLIGIENKKWTGQSENQLADYWTHLKKEAGTSRKPILIYISSEDPGNSSLFQVPYHHADEEVPSIARVLRIARRDIKAARINDFIEDFSGWIDRTFARIGGGEMDIYRETIVEAIRRDRNSNQAKAIGAVLLSGEALTRNYIQEVQGHIVKAVGAEIPDIAVVPTPQWDDLHPLDEWIDEKWQWWVLRCSSWPARCFLFMSSDLGKRRSLVYGVGALDPDSDEGRMAEYEAYRSERIAELNDAVAAYGGHGCYEPWIRWSRSIQTADWTMEAIGDALVRGERFPGEGLGVGKVIEDFIGLAKAISAIG
jgi:hypothetical protein